MPVAQLAPSALICEIGAGEALFIPHHWAHAVLSANEPASGFGLNLAVNVWWETPAQHLKSSLWRYGCTAIALGMYALSMRPGLLRPRAGRLQVHRGPRRSRRGDNRPETESPGA